jgi:formylglycine-generating enzyme required for sulfatase activity
MKQIFTRPAFFILRCSFFIGLPMAGLATPIATVTSTTQSATTRMVSVAFDLSEPAIVTLGAQISTDGGSSWTDMDDVVLHVVGDVNRKLAAGSGYTALWNADRDWPGHPAEGETIRPVVRCWTEGNPPDYLVMSLLDKSRRWYFTDASQIPGGVTNRLYKTDYLVMRRIHARNIVWPMAPVTTEEGRIGGNSPGGENPQHYVQLTNDYYMAVFPGTVGQSRLLFTDSNLRVSSNNGTSWFPTDACHHLGLRGYRPVGGSWTWAAGGQPPTAGSNLDTLRSATGLRFDLPTEAQWEYAARAGTGTARPDMDIPASDVAWFAENSGGATHEVGLLKANPWGLYDMFGNVTEWCRDYAAGYPSSEDIASPVVFPTGPAAATDGNNYRVKRGGSFRSPARWVRSSKRGYDNQSYSQGTNSADEGSGGAYTSGYRLIIELD